MNKDKLASHARQGADRIECAGRSFMRSSAQGWRYWQAAPRAEKLLIAILLLVFVCILQANAAYNAATAAAEHASHAYDAASEASRSATAAQNAAEQAQSEAAAAARQPR